ncbi:MAG: GNAT family N-acetyltransferase [Brumimicrobium sp.]|nr:GNAT family N-acetyltransferase [Brumimicrobium sp.]
MVENTPCALVSSLSFYWDATAQDWDAYLAEDYSYGIPVGVTTKGGIRRLYYPLFQKFHEPLGNKGDIDWIDFENSLLERFKKGELIVNNTVPLRIKKEQLLTQILTKEQYNLKTQAKRMLKKFEQSQLEINDKDVKLDKLLRVIITELSKKLNVFNPKESQTLYTLFNEAEKLGLLYKVGLYEKGELIGGLIGTQYKNQLLYIKGTATEESQKNGSMYALMNHLISHGFEHNCLIDFGGSNAEGVRYFNTRFGAEDVYYFHYSWDNSPWWFKIFYGMYQKIKGR